MIIQGRLLIDPHAPPQPGWIRIDADRISDIQFGFPRFKSDHGSAHSIISPGFIDAHIHLPQIESIGCDGMELLDWLERIIFPAESAWFDARCAARHIELAHRRMIASGTLGYAGYLTAHTTGPDWFQSHSHTAMMPRALVGQVLMDRHAPPSLLGQNPLDPQTIQLSPPHELSVNPRFAISCSEATLSLAATLAGNTRFIQTHLAESLAECRRIAELFPQSAHYTGVYDEFGLLCERTLLAHCIHLSAAEWHLIRDRGCVVVHCPGANTFLRSGMFDLTAACEHGVRLALGSDVAAGPDIAMPRVARAMIEVAKLRANATSSIGFVPTPADAWSLITRGNADALGWRDGGRIEPGARADLLVLQPPVELDEHLIGRLIYNWDNSFITHRIVGGRLVPTCPDD